MKSIGIITIHKINNYGSVLQAYALLTKCEELGYKAEIIDYLFPNKFQQEKGIKSAKTKVTLKDKFIKYLYGFYLVQQHKGISKFVHKFHKLSSIEYCSPEQLKKDPPNYDIYITGSDQLWNPNYCCGDPSFFLDFVPDGKKRLAYAASFGISKIDKSLENTYKSYLQKYSAISVRENSGVNLANFLTNSDKTQVVLDPSLLLNKNEWNKLALRSRIIKQKYILCYFLNYSFDAFPYVDQLAEHIQNMTGYTLVKVARPPRHLFEKNTIYRVGADPHEFLALVRDAELILTTSFHGTAFAVNYSRPLFSVVADKNASDSRQVSLLQNVGLESRILSIKDKFPSKEELNCSYDEASKKLELLRNKSLNFLKNALDN